jgi:hypothetical protein
VFHVASNLAMTHEIGQAGAGYGSGDSARTGVGMIPTCE